MFQARRWIDPVRRPEHRGRDKAAAEPRPPSAEFDCARGGPCDLTQRDLLCADPRLFGQMPPAPKKYWSQESGKYPGKQAWRSFRGFPATCCCRKTAAAPLAKSNSAMILKHMLNQSAALDLMFQALADPSRRVMVERLTRGPASVSELAKPLAMSLPAVVQHLQVLEASGLVRSEKVGTRAHLSHRAQGAAVGRAMDRRAADHLGAQARPSRRLSRRRDGRAGQEERRVIDQLARHAMSLKLYFHPLSSFCHKVLIALYENRHAVRAAHRRSVRRGGGYRKIAPIGKIPVLRDEAKDPHDPRDQHHHRISGAAFSGQDAALSRRSRPVSADAPARPDSTTSMSTCRCKTSSPTGCVLRTRRILSAWIRRELC